jgi:hypothetical protein
VTEEGNAGEQSIDSDNALASAKAAAKAKLQPRNQTRRKRKYRRKQRRCKRQQNPRSNLSPTKAQWNPRGGQLEPTAKDKAPAIAVNMSAL